MIVSRLPERIITETCGGLGAAWQMSRSVAGGQERPTPQHVSLPASVGSFHVPSSESHGGQGHEFTGQAGKEDESRRPGT